MTQLTWGGAGDRVYQTGLDRGVLYLQDGTGVSWSGLLAVAETRSTTTSTPLYFNGKKYADLVASGDFNAKLSAFTYPDEFLEFDGYGVVGNGLLFDKQQRKTFGLCYRTLIGNDVEGTSHGYFLHVLYNLTAVPDDISYETLSDSGEAAEFSWTITSVPEDIVGYKPTGHILIDSRKVDAETLAIVESLLYGSADNDAMLLSVAALNELLSRSLTDVTIIDNGDGTWFAVGPDALITMVDPTTFEISGVSVGYLDADTYTLSST